MTKIYPNNSYDEKQSFKQITDEICSRDKCVNGSNDGVTNFMKRLPGAKTLPWKKISHMAM